jgi:hypothetical protein
MSLLASNSIGFSTFSQATTSKSSSTLDGNISEKEAQVQHCDPEVDDGWYAVLLRVEQLAEWYTH